jgi:hypothetical protein
MTGKPLVTCQTGSNESFLIGTREQLLSLAESILQAIHSAAPNNFFGHSVLTSNTLSGKLDSKGDLGIDEVVVVETDEQKDAVFYSVYNS